MATYYALCYRQHHVTSPSLSSSWNLLTCKVVADSRETEPPSVLTCVEELNTDLAFIYLGMYLYTFLFSFIFSFSFSFSRFTFLPLFSLFISLFYFVSFSLFYPLCSFYSPYYCLFLNIVLCFPSLRSLFLHFQFIFLFFLLTLPLTHNHFHK